MFKSDRGGLDFTLGGIPADKLLASLALLFHNSRVELLTVCTFPDRIMFVIHSLCRLMLSVTS